MNKTASSENMASEIARPGFSYTGMAFFLASETFLFGSLFWTYYYLRAATPLWPPAGVETDLKLAAINTGILLASSLAVWWAGRSVRQGKSAGTTRGLILTILLAAVFLGITIYEWTHASFRPWSHAYGSIFYTMTGFHAFHVFGGILVLSSMLVRNLRGVLSTGALEVGSLYWHFVDFIWIIVFTTLFIVR